MVGGLPWEQGRLSVYLSWIPMILVIFFACHQFKEDLEDKPLSISDWSVVIGMLLLGLPAFVSIYPQASWQWLTQVMLLAFFAWSLRQLHVGRRELLTWAVVAIVPHAVLGIWQYATQFVAGSKWLGMASQNPADLGVSVIEIGGRRVLRAYGSFPHPNILGGWLAFGLAAIALLGSYNENRRRRIGLVITGILFSLALVFSFSRAAWIAAAIGIIAALAFVWQKTWTREDRRRALLIPFVIAVTTVGSVFVVRDVVSVRAQTETRLEAKSVHERSDALAASWQLVGEEWWLGQGQNTAIYALDKAGSGIIPPHLVFLLILLETGLIGVLGAVLLLARWLRYSGRFGVLLLATIAPLILFDHYLWSLWAGQSLAMLFAFLPLTREDK
jgi:hypothetical protein